MRSGLLTAQKSSRKARTCSPALNLVWTASRALCCPRANNMGMRKSPCSPPSSCGTFWVTPTSSSHKHVGGAAIEAPHKGEGLISTSHPQEASEHCDPGGQIVRPDPVNRHDSRFRIKICQSHEDASNALPPCFGCQGVLEGGCGSCSLFRDLFGDRPIHQSLENVSLTTIPLTPPTGPRLLPQR